jgi:plastocyanin
MMCQNTMNRKRISIWVAMLWVSATGLHSQAVAQLMPTPTLATTTVRGRVEVIGANAGAKVRHGAIPGTVVWLTPIGLSMTGAGGEATVTSPNPSPSPAQNPRLVQKNKSFEPHILVVPAGSMVEFPNRDPFFHNVFSLFEGKRFDLGLYEAGTTRMVRFDRPGISYIFCNIHPEMSAVVITMATPLYAISNADGQLSVAGVPYGRYMLHIWSEGMGPENTQPLTREITIAENASSLGVIRVPEVNGQRMAHKNKYGRDYDEALPNNSVYEQQR